MSEAVAECWHTKLAHQLLLTNVLQRPQRHKEDVLIYGWVNFRALSKNFPYTICSIGFVYVYSSTLLQHVRSSGRNSKAKRLHPRRALLRKLNFWSLVCSQSNFVPFQSLSPVTFPSLLCSSSHHRPFEFRTVATLSVRIGHWHDKPVPVVMAFCPDIHVFVLVYTATRCTMFLWPWTVMLRHLNAFVGSLSYPSSQPWTLDLMASPQENANIRPSYPFIISLPLPIRFKCGISCAECNGDWRAKRINLAFRGVIS